MKSLGDLGRFLERPVGILGGGQLARMLAEAAHRLGLRPIVLAGSADDPAARLCPGSVFGDPARLYDDPVVLRRFFSQVSEVVFENEFVPCEALELAARGTGASFRPGLRALFQLQDKIRQKEILLGLGIPASPFQVLPRDRAGEVAAWAGQMFSAFKGECVFKWAQLGYDGKGTWISGPDRPPEGAIAFCEEAVRKRVPLYVEQKVRYRRELALVASYSVTGEFVAYPLVVSRQENGICRLVTGPATALGVSEALEKRAHAHAKRLAEALSLHGTFAIELFETEGGELWVNELAPRVHNTGHYTQDACATSQFENHWRAVLGLPLGEVTVAPAFAMLNLLGPKEDIDISGPAARDAGDRRIGERAHFHWYGKKDIRPGRKLGHLNGRAGSVAELDGLVQELEDCEREWVDALAADKGES